MPKPFNWNVVIACCAVLMFMLGIGTIFYNNGQTVQHLNDLEALELRTEVSLDNLHMKVVEVAERTARIEGYLENMRSTARK